jgi:20S proteasome alpha/beta subunit
MTTIVGIKAACGKQGVVLASDVSRTSTSWNSQGDVAYRQQTKEEAQKIYVADDNSFAVCMSGNYDRAYINFLTSLLKGKIDLEKVLTEGDFPQLRDMNLSRWGRVEPNNDINYLMVASRFKKNPALHTLYPLGKVVSNEYGALGSGHAFATDAIKAKGVLIPGYLSLRDAIGLASESLEKASKDIYTGGLDMVVVRPDKIVSLGSEIGSAVKSAKQRTVEKIRKRF